MKCISPLRIRRKSPHPAGDFIDVPCGKCAHCMQNKRTEWSIRLQKELQFASSAVFVTLTYSDDYFYDYMLKASDFQAAYIHCKSVHKKDLQDFMKRFRYHDGSPNIRYFAVGEYGEKTYRPHYHLLLFNCDFSRISENLGNSWLFGHFHVGEVNESSIHYVTGYVLTKKFRPSDDVDYSFSLMSRRPGIGHCFVYSNYGRLLSSDPSPYLVLRGGMKVPIPRYFKDKLYTEEQKYFLKLDVQAYADEHYVDPLMYSRYLYNNERVLNRFSKNKINNL